MSLLGKSGGMEFNHVPFKGGGPLMNDAIAGHIPLSMATVFLNKPHIDSKRLRPLAVTSAKRVADFPDVPTIAEAGFAGFEAPAWWALLATSRAALALHPGEPKMLCHRSRHDVACRTLRAIRTY